MLKTRPLITCRINSDNKIHAADVTRKISPGVGVVNRDPKEAVAANRRRKNLIILEAVNGEEDPRQHRLQIAEVLATEAFNVDGGVEEPPSKVIDLNLRNGLMTPTGILMKVKW